MYGCGEVVVCRRDLNRVREAMAKLDCGATYGRSTEARDFREIRRKFEYGCLMRRCDVVSLGHPVIERLRIHL
jgi:hypothetical protein